MIKIDENGITCTKGDIFNMLIVPDIWDDEAVYTAEATVDRDSVTFECSLFRNKYVRVYSNEMTINKGIGTIIIEKDGEEVLNKPFIVEEVSHNG